MGFQLALVAHALSRLVFQLARRLHPAFSRQLLVGRYVIAASTPLPLAPNGKGGRGVTRRSRHFDRATLVTGAEAAAQVVPVSPPPSLLRLTSRAPYTPQPRPRHVPETRRGEPCGGDRRGEAGEMEGVRAGEQGATVMGRESVSHRCELVAIVSGPAGVGYFIRHAGRLKLCYNWPSLGAGRVFGKTE